MRCFIKSCIVSNNNNSKKKKKRKKRKKENVGLKMFGYKRIHDRNYMLAKYMQQYKNYNTFMNEIFFLLT